MHTGPRISVPTDAAPAVSIRRLTKSYGPRVALDHLDLTVPAGGIHALLGPNGSGKTTTLRILMGLVRPRGGEITMLGEEIPKNLPRVIDRVGAVIEQPRFHPHVSVERNLIIFATASGVPLHRVPECLDRLDMLHERRQAFRTLSLGGRQRVGIAATLLKDPELLIFDEPTNGLDPAGIQEVRETLTQLAADGSTVLISSHLLAEVQHMATSASIIDHGRLVTEGSMDAIVQERAHRISVGVRDATRAQRILSEHDLSVQPGTDNDLIVTLNEADHSDTARITALLAREGLYVHKLIALPPSLEATFLKLTGAGSG